MAPPPPLSPPRWLPRLLSLVVLLTVGLGLEWGRPNPPAAEASITNFLVGGRRNRGRRSANRAKGGGSRTGRINGGWDPRLPYVITTRNTLLRSDQFTLTWNPVEGASTYTVKLWQWEDANGGRQPQPLWETTTTDTSLVYSGNPPLSPESFYSFQVTTDQGTSSDQDGGCAAAGFAVLFPETRSRLEADLAAIDRSQLTAEELALAQAEIYLNYQMLDAGIDVLSTQLALTPTAALHLALADFYSFSGLNALAQDHYNQALTLATETDDELWRAVALEGLGEIAILRNDLDTALDQLTQAQVSYRLADVPLRAHQIGLRIALLKDAQRLGIRITEAPEACG